MVEQPLKLESSSGRKRDRDCISSHSKAESVRFQFNELIQNLVPDLVYHYLGCFQGLWINEI